jgi:hypothetical protein
MNCCPDFRAAVLIPHAEARIDRRSAFYFQLFIIFPLRPVVPWSRSPLSAFSFPNFTFPAWPAPAAEGRRSSDGPAEARGDSLAADRSLAYSVSPCKRELAV